MPRKTKIIFITVFIITLTILLGVYFYNKSKNPNTTDPNATFYQKFNPFSPGNKIPVNPDAKPDETNKPGEGVTSKESSKFYQITDFAVAGATFLEDTRLVDITNTDIEGVALEEKDPYEKAPSVRYVERKNGHVYKMFLDTKTKEKISNLTITAIYESYFNSKADTVLYRYLSDDETINSLAMKIGSSTKDFLPQNITDMAVSLDKTKYFYLVKNGNGSTGVSGNFEDKKESIVFSSPFTEWLPQWTNNQNIFLTTKPYYASNGSIFILNTANKTITKLFGGIAGLTTLVNSNGSDILYSVSTGNGPRLNVFNINKHSSVDLKTSGLPEKCAWSNDDVTVYCAIPNTIVGNQYPNSWYQGLVSFDDYFVKINTTTGERITLANSKDEIPVDSINMFLSKAEDKLFFVNKKDYTLWSLDL
ncbi:MAG: hypothetical protein UR85_C0002G0062 [Candidatus Nomurabacteria bacterium GW2011_GWF2_35_66]|uniref:Protein TolB n=1 Tax=Candidatus Nomurabacteria bacterium GW2011_GWE1_35_16 TaxID=1618761 RepID=A0A0G0BSL1_9BACT|nr:MAG: hypothetical protein UR55_C0004G0022 [Candidatus Nomurabacteria bacterium GW2011_GWF1_34_20]KKP63461.1 MAG: hypothetical protein UR57_C0004G0022 [Candidatus Nomurabacteria bacterium GW2011_GWE2_34_25]KKP66641.1 MAG: hypothetical protein UR64_C0004G0022 [Candidatus Nomurabacteria bacterium GW2011_GWE1_35_16]KKP83749.1 MAG: hypothetical protein UR85_C0002G0062 [Candidatus Nomurabacteria bacterium GW2011_GWF2_35_66]HAE36440.1 hypothetical protein [Candidatus Nomurabacteria bacterium]